ncbi:MAG: folylpolyglutamate synthase/dihydrofolate synthase family protein [Nakamurella sp.]
MSRDDDAAWREGDDESELAADEIWDAFDSTDPLRPEATAQEKEAILEPDPTGEIARATADLDDQTDQLTELDPDLTLDGVESLLNQRWPETTIEPSLDRISALVDALGHPESAYPVVQVAGTNGKTSTARMIDALFVRIGMRTGRFTSPHLQSVTERISIDGAPVSAADYVNAFTDVAHFVGLVDTAQQQAGGVRLSKFEVLTAMAYAAFADAPVQVGVIEVGLGGRWDSTNVASAQVAVITPVGLDHMEYLGDTLTAIAGEKAGIIKEGATVVIGAQPAEAMKVILHRAVEMDATVARYGSEFSVLTRRVAVGGQRLSLQGLGGVYDDIFLPLHGPHQAENAAVALAAVEAFFGAGVDKQLDLAMVQDAFASVSSPGRLERIGTAPTMLIDAAHNPDGASALAAALADEFAFSHLVGVVAVMADKDATGILTALLDTLDEVVVTQNSSPRAMPAADLAEVAITVFGEERVHLADALPAALNLARELASARTGSDDDTVGPGSGVLITGSVVTAGDARELAGRVPQ